MKDLSTYLSGTPITDYIQEARTLKDLKGKQVSKIKVDSRNLVWKPVRHNTLEVTLKTSTPTEEDIKEIYEPLKKKSVDEIDVCFNVIFNGQEEPMTLRIERDSNRYLHVYRYNGNSYLGDSIVDNNERDFVDWLHHYIINWLPIN
ncbi:MAG: hypothetical protein IIZ78_14885 [Clostridiales bacterium]|nr:hypothetical protein [Clostridiales bacterium]